MTRLIIVVEGQTEEAFVTHVLAPHLNGLGVYASATIVGKIVALRRGHRHRGGGHFKHWKNDLDTILKHDRSDGLRVTTLFDLYGLPDDFPGLQDHESDRDTNRRCDALQHALGEVVNDRRFIPYLQRHEFEALVLASLDSLECLLDDETDLQQLSVLRSSIADVPVEDINDGPDTAPSKRLEATIPGYSKTVHGPLVTHDAGLTRLRQQCPRFDAWLTRLEALQSSGSDVTDG